MELDTITCMDALALTASLEDASVDLIATDPPFNIGKAEWDSWPTLAAYLDWLGEHLRAFRRVLKPNGSLYLFGWPTYGAKTELEIAKYFNVLNRITWAKQVSRAEMADKDALRCFFTASEVIYFAEQYGSDKPYQDALIDGNDTYWTACETARRKIFGDEIARAMAETNTSAHELTGAIGAHGTVNHGGAVSNWVNGFNIPLPEYYYSMRDYLNGKSNGEYLRREYEDLRREYEDLRREYEDLRRPFNATPDAPYTDVWTFPTVAQYEGKHECEKPLEMMRHIISVSSKPSAVVYDPFCGSGATLKAARQLGRHYIGGDASPHWAEYARVNVSRIGGNIRFTKPEQNSNWHKQLSLFAQEDD